MTDFLTRRNRQEPTATPTPAETRQEAFANAVAAFRQATGKAEARVVPCRCAVSGEPFAIHFERISRRTGSRSPASSGPKRLGAKAKPRAACLAASHNNNNNPMRPANSTGPAASARTAATAPGLSIATAAAKPSAPAGSGRCRTEARLSPAMTAAAPPARPDPPATSAAAPARAVRRLVTRCNYPDPSQPETRCR